MPYTISFDATETPSHNDLRKFKVTKMSVLVFGPAGGNPLLTITFASLDDARTFAQAWFGGMEDEVTVSDWLDEHEVGPVIFTHG